MKIFSYLTVFLLAGLFLASFVDDARAGNGPIPGECQDQCKFCCDAGQYKVDFGCQGLTGEARKECNTFATILSKCCYIECLDETCPVGQDGEDDIGDAPGDSSICEFIEERCDSNTCDQ